MNPFNVLKSFANTIVVIKLPIPGQLNIVSTKMSALKTVANVRLVIDNFSAMVFLKKSLYISTWILKFLFLFFLISSSVNLEVNEIFVIFWYKVTRSQLNVNEGNIKWTRPSKNKLLFKLIIESINIKPDAGIIPKNIVLGRSPNWLELYRPW